MMSTGAFDVSSFGVRVRVDVDVESGELAEAVSLALPPGGPPAAGQYVSARFALESEGDAVMFVRDDDADGQPMDLDLAVRLLETRLAEIVATGASDRTFVGAGVVVLDRRALVLPGSSVSGRTTLVDALARAAATVYSDTFAVFDADGLVSPYRPGSDDDLPAVPSRPSPPSRSGRGRAGLRSSAAPPTARSPCWPAR